MNCYVLIVENRQRANERARWSRWRIEDEIPAGSKKRQALVSLKEEQQEDKKNNNEFFQVRTRLFKLVEVKS